MRIIRKSGPENPELLRQIQAVEKELEELGRKIEECREKECEEDPIADWLNTALGVLRVQRLTGDGWETIEYQIQVASGGPEIWVSTRGVIWGSWLPTSIEAELSEEAGKALEEVEEILNSIHSE